MPARATAWASHQFHSSSSSSRLLLLLLSLRAGDGVGASGLCCGRSTLPSAGASSSSSRSDCALAPDAEGEGNEVGVGDELSGESDAAKGLEEMETDVAVEEGVGEDAAGVNAAKSELAASEKRRDARFWLFVNLVRALGVSHRLEPVWKPPDDTERCGLRMKLRTGRLTYRLSGSLPTSSPRCYQHCPSMPTPTDSLADQALGSTRQAEAQSHQPADSTVSTSRVVSRRSSPSPVS